MNECDAVEAGGFKEWLGAAYQKRGGMQRMQRIGRRTMMREDLLAMSARDRRPFVYRRIAREEESESASQAWP
jgi:hypothetical protein